MYSEQEFFIKSYQTDKNAKMNIQSMFLLLQEAAWENASMNKMGFEELDAHNSYWVLSRILLEIDEIPSWKDDIVVRTWPNGYEGFTAIRDFEVLKNNVIIARAKSNWLVLDKERHRPQKLDNYNLENLKTHLRDAIDIQLEKISSSDELIELDKRMVFYSDIDVNRHVNNSEYVRWILDSFYKEAYRTVKRIEVNFLSELTEGDCFSVLKNDVSANKEFFVIKKDEKDVCRVLIDY